MAPARVADLIAASSFYVAHRGSGDNWPEHSLLAYQSSLRAGADAVEISVCATSDGVLVCHHDLSGQRTLGVDRDIADLTWAELSSLRIDARTWLGERTPLEPVSRLEDVLAALGDEVLAFVEDKQGTNTVAVLDLLDAQPRSTERFVWKQWAPASQVSAAKERGYVAWGYFDVDQFDRLDEFASTFDILGVPTSIGDDDLARVVATGVPVMCWEVHFHDEIERLARLGVAGRMCSNIPYLRADTAAQTDAFASGRRAAGDLPSGFDRTGWNAQPAIVPDRAALRIQSGGAHSYLMGSLAESGSALQSLDLTVRWPDGIPDDGSVGVVFAATGDAPGGDAERGAGDGYELALASEGILRLSERVSGRTGAAMFEQRVPPPSAGEDFTLSVALDADRVRVSVPERDATFEVADARWRGPWVRLFKDYESALAVEFSSVRSVLV